MTSVRALEPHVRGPSTRTPCGLIARDTRLLNRRTVVDERGRAIKLSKLLPLRKELLALRWNRTTYPLAKLSSFGSLNRRERGRLLQPARCRHALRVEHALLAVALRDRLAFCLITVE